MNWISRVTDPSNLQLVGLPPKDLLDAVMAGWAAAGLDAIECLKDWVFILASMIIILCFTSILRDAGELAIPVAFLACTTFVVGVQEALSRYDVCLSVSERGTHLTYEQSRQNRCSHQHPAHGV